MRKHFTLMAAFAVALSACEAPPAPVAEPVPVVAPTPPPPIALPAWSTDNRFAEVIIEASNGTVIYGVDETAPRHIASLTKIMTAYMVFTALADGRLTPETVLTVSPAAAAQGGTGLDLAVGTQITVDDALNALITISANDAAVVLAESLAGTEGAFAQQMTAEAARLGTHSTTFRTASGLTQLGQISSARDIAVIFARLQRDYPTYFAAYFSAPAVDIQGKTLRNCALCYEPGAHITGHKGGFTNAAGQSLAAITQHEGRTQVIVTLGAPSNPDRTARLLQLARHYPAA